MFYWWISGFLREPLKSLSQRFAKSILFRYVRRESVLAKWFPRYYYNVSAWKAVEFLLELGYDKDWIECVYALNMAAREEKISVLGYLNDSIHDPDESKPIKVPFKVIQRGYMVINRSDPPGTVELADPDGYWSGLRFSRKELIKVFSQKAKSPEKT